MNKMLIMLILISYILLALLLPLRAKNKTYTEYQTKWASEREMVIWEIKAQARKYGVSEATALRIARCESSYDPTARNKYSSAKGIYQFIDKTFKNYCQGDVMNYKDNIECFMKLYSKYPGYWECK